MSSLVVAVFERAVGTSEARAVCGFSAEGEVRLWSPGAERLFGWPEGEVLNGPAPFVPLEDRAEHQGLLERVLAGDAVESIIVERRHRDGRPLLLRMSAQPLRGPKEDPGCGDRLQTLGRLVGGVVHDFNNLLTVVLGNSEYALSTLTADHPARRELQDVYEAGRQAAGLTRQLLNFSRPRSATRQPSDAGAVVARLEPMLRRLLPEDLQVTIDRTPSPVPVSIDPAKLEQVVMNLVLNARDAMAGGGQIQVELGEVEVAARRPGFPHGVAPGRWVRLSVRDSGSGMSEQTRAHVFEPFFTTKAPDRGTGLGLTITREIIEGAGGALQVESAPGQGTTVEVYLPLSRDVAVTAPAPKQPAPRGDETILLVEDDAPVRTSMKAALEHLGYRVHAVEGASQALGVGANQLQHVDLLLTDVVLPLPGVQPLVAGLSARKPGLRVLYTSGYTDEVVAQHGLEPGRHEWLEKPFSSQALAEAVRKALGSRSKSPVPR